MATQYQTPDKPVLSFKKFSLKKQGDSTSVASRTYKQEIRFQLEESSVVNEDTQIKSILDSRTYLIGIGIGIISALFIHSEVGFALMFAVVLIVNVIAGQGRSVVGYVVTYLVLLGLTWCGVRLVMTNPASALGLSLTSMGTVGRRALIPLSMAVGLARQPTGALLAAFRALRLPKVTGIGFAIILRFFPTIGEEYRSIRHSQKFKGVGLGIVQTITHLPSTFEHILVPLIIRIMRISDELSASVTVRGVRFSGDTISFRPIGFQVKDIVVIVLLSVSCVVLLVATGPAGVLP